MALYNKLILVPWPYLKPTGVQRVAKNLYQTVVGRLKLCHPTELKSLFWDSFPK